MCTETLIFENFQAVIGGGGYGEAFGGGPTQIWMDDVHCAGSESTLSACPFNGWGNHNCVQAENVGVCCQGCPPGSGCNGGAAAAAAAGGSSRHKALPSSLAGVPLPVFSFFLYAHACQRFEATASPKGCSWVILDLWFRVYCFGFRLVTSRHKFS